VTEDERLELLRRMVTMQGTMRSLVDYVDAVAAECDKSGEKGLAFSIYMIREALSAYSSQVVRYSKKVLLEEE
jgi:hypothetical protein